MSDCGGPLECTVGDRIWVSNCVELRVKDNHVLCRLPNNQSCSGLNSPMPDWCYFTKTVVSNQTLGWKCYAAGNDGETERNPTESGIFTQREIEMCTVVDLTTTP